MIEITFGNAENLVIAVAKGMMTEVDLVNVLIPTVKSRLKTRKRIRLLLQLDNGLSEFAAEAIWDNAKLRLGHLSAFDAIAVVTDENWIIGAVKSFRYILGYPVKPFKKVKLAEAKDWVARNNSARSQERVHRIAFDWSSERDTRTTNSSIPSAGFPALGITSQIQSILSK